MLFADIVTPSEQRMGYLPVNDIIRRYLASEKYAMKPDGSHYIIASVLIGEHRYDLEAWNDTVEKGLFWSVGEVDENGVFAPALEDFEFEGDIFPLTVEALVQVLGTTLKLNPNDIKRDAINLLSYWETNGIHDFKMPSQEEAQRHRLAA